MNENVQRKTAHNSQPQHQNNLCYNGAWKWILPIPLLIGYILIHNSPTESEQSVYWLQKRKKRTKLI